MLAHQLVRGEASGEFTKMNAIMGEDIEETGDFIVNEKDKVVNLTEEGVKKVEQFFKIENLADPENLEIQHNIILALRANYLMFRDKDYVVKDDQVMIVDEFTGRIMPGRRYSDAAAICLQHWERQYEIHRKNWYPVVGRGHRFPGTGRAEDPPAGSKPKGLGGSPAAFGFGAPIPHR